MKSACPHCGWKDDHEFVGVRLHVWFRCERCATSWRGSVWSSLFAHTPAADLSNRFGPPGGLVPDARDESTFDPVAVRLTPTRPVPPNVSGRDVETWLRGIDAEIGRVTAAPLAFEEQLGAIGVPGAHGRSEPPTTVTANDGFAAILDSPAIAARKIVDTCPRGGVARAMRYQARLPIVFRRVDEPDWYSGTTENVSRSGILFRLHERPATLALDSGPTLLDLALHLPDRTDTAAPLVRCHATVVRLRSLDAGRTQPAVAVTVDDYRLAR